MKRSACLPLRSALAVALLVAFVSVHALAQTTTSHNYEFANGNWFDGQKFVPRTFYSVGGVLTSKRPARIDRVFDFSGKYIVPPFGEAHNHNLDWSSDEQFARINKRYLDAGIFYVKNPNSLLRSKEPTSAHINLPTTVDGILSNGGLTGSGGHPIEIVSPQRGFQPGDGEGGFYYVIDSAAEFERKWPAIKAGRPDFHQDLPALLRRVCKAQRRQSLRWLERSRSRSAAADRSSCPCRRFAGFDAR